ncbi:MAG: hypothetical protein ACRD4M_15230, partial [Candidatus Acidiferrales bacterium]
RSTTTSATTTNLFSSTASSTNLFSTSGNIGTLTLGSLSSALSASNGGTGISNPGAAGILLGSYAGGAWQQLATSSLGLLTTNVSEGTNLYFTNARADARINATSTIGTLQYLPNLVNTTTTAATTTNLFATTASSTNLFAQNLFANTTNLTENGNLFYTNARFDTALEGTTTLNNLTTLKGLTDLISTRATTTQATSTNFAVSTLCISGDCKTSWPSTSNAASSTLLDDNNTFSGSNTFSQAITGSVSGNAGSVTNGVYTTTFNNLFDTRLSGTTTLNNLTTLKGLTDLITTRSTTTSATTTNLFSSTASSTNLFSTSGNIGTLTLGSLSSALS